MEFGLDQVPKVVPSKLDESVDDAEDDNHTLPTRVVAGGAALIVLIGLVFGYLLQIPFLVALRFDSSAQI